jgi:hypothetical protein
VSARSISIRSRGFVPLRAIQAIAVCRTSRASGASIRPSTAAITTNAGITVRLVEIDVMPLQIVLRSRVRQISGHPIVSRSKRTESLILRLFVFVRCRQPTGGNLWTG